jgi:GNAT superfamily N-acetyltransferase
MDYPPPEPRTHILVAVPPQREAKGGTVIAGLVFEYYRGSRCGLLTYVVVEPAWRRRGIGGRLMDRALEILTEEAAAEGHRLQAVFAEVEDPTKIPASESAMPPADRVRALAGAARRVAISYVQPQLIGGSGRDRRLMLTAILRPGENSRSLSADVLLGFLHEFYQALGIQEPERDVDFQAMRAACGVRVSLEPLVPGEDRT